LFDQFSEVHDGDVIAHVAHDGEVMSDEEVGQFEFVLEVFEEVENLGLDADVEGANGFVTDEEFGLDGEGAGDADALALAAAEFVRIPAGGVGWEADFFEEIGDGFLAFIAGQGAKVDGEGFIDDGTDLHAGVEGAYGVLEDHLQVFAKGAEFALAEGKDFSVVVKGLAAGGAEEFEEGAGDGGFAAPAFTDEAQGLAVFDVEADVIDGFDDVLAASEPAAANGEVDFEVLDAEKCHGQMVITGASVR
jgi:hypothetical protein